MLIVAFHVPGVPRPQGSKRCFNNRPVEVSKHVARWRRDVKAVAKQHMDQATPITEGDVALFLDFKFLRPKSHRYVDGRLKPGRSEWHTQRPDVDKLARAVLDALTGTAFVDDSQVTALTAEKLWVDKPEDAGVTVTVVLRQRIRETIAHS